MRPGYIVAIACLVLLALTIKYRFVQECGWRGALRGFEFVWLVRGC